MRYSRVPQRNRGFASRIRLLTFLVACLRLSPIAAQPTQPTPRDRPPVKVEKVYPLPFFCIAEGLQGEHTLNPLPAASHFAGEICGLTSIFVAPGNADDVATKLQPQPAAPAAGGAAITTAAVVTGTATVTAAGTSAAQRNQFTLAATDDKRSVIVLFRTQLSAGDLAKLEAAIDRLARPSYVYFKNYPIDSAKTGKALVKAVPVMNSKLRAEVVSPAQLRVESDKPLSAAELAVFETRFNRDKAAIVAAATSPSQDEVNKEIKKDLQGPSPDVQVAAVDLPYFCQSGNLSDAPTPPEKDACPDGTRKVQANNIDQVIHALNAALGKASKLTLSKDGNRALIGCETKCSGDALQIAQDTVTATARVTPAFVQDIEVPRGTSGIAAAALNSPPISAASITDTIVRLASDSPVPQTDLDARLERARELGFGSPELPPMQRMFYRAATDVVGDLLSTPPPGTPAALGGNAATPPVTSAAESAAAASPAASTATSPATTASPATTISITNNPPAAAATPAAPAPGPAPTGTVGQGMTSVDDMVVFTDTTSAPAVRQRVRLLTMLDLPRPEVLMNMWSLQASSPKGKEIAQGLQKVRDTVSANNDALQHAIDFGWAYLSRQINLPGNDFFDPAFYQYLTQRFVADTPKCEAHDPQAQDCLTTAQREQWRLCSSGQYCLGYSDAFKPLSPTLTNIILAMMASKHTAKTVLTTIACMEGKFEVYPDCFPDRPGLLSVVSGPANAVRAAEAAAEAKQNMSVADQAKADAKQADLDAKQEKEDAAGTVKCLKDQRKIFLQSKGVLDEPMGADVVVPPRVNSAVGCEMLDRAAVFAQRACRQPAALPLSCFTLQAASSFLPEYSYSTFSLSRLNDLAEERIADLDLPSQQREYSSTNIGVLRSAVADFLFNYRIAQQYPAEFSPYSLSHSAQELNARFNPLVVAFNQDVAAFSRTLMDDIQSDLPNQNHIWQLWRHNKSFVSNGLVSVRGISGVESLVDTDTQNSFDSTQAQTLNAVLSSITGAGSSAAPASSGVQNTINLNPDGTVPPAPAATSPSPLTAIGGLFKGATSATAIATALAAITPTETHSIIGRQLTLDVIPHTLPGASSAELDVRL